MDYLDLQKESLVEYCENAYALGIKKINNFKIKGLLDELTTYEDQVRIVNNIEKFNKLKKIIVEVVSRIEGVINEC